MLAFSRKTAGAWRKVDQLKTKTFPWVRVGDGLDIQSWGT